MEIVFFIIIGIFAFIWLNRKSKNNYESENTFSELSFEKEDYRMFPHIEKKELTLEQAISKIELVVQKDDFEGTTSIHFNNITQNDYKYLPMYFKQIGEIAVSHEHIGISFSIFQDRIYLDIYSNVQEMGLAKGDQLILLFENGEKIDIKFPFARSSGYTKSNTYPINESELEIFAEQKLDKWKLISSRKNIYIVGNNSLFFELCEIKEKSMAQEIIKYLAKTIKYKHLNKTLYNTVKPT
ncbi:hypothetical protein Q4Q35_08865 [Flavivirga aquimarina]|uniref:DUF4230 domain-containing protein n=1 Tax=Flavivirga aquimarina TaxID=2027862 RepID=A0ABT8W9U8_9FLAO|nr:hypothetical protein [Flavivirga aquimarina]MDO5969919.1 hypothetical protein [Flavivirga aquimarina]